MKNSIELNTTTLLLGLIAAGGAYFIFTRDGNSSGNNNGGTTGSGNTTPGVLPLSALSPSDLQGGFFTNGVRNGVPEQIWQKGTRKYWANDLYAQQLQYNSASQTWFHPSTIDNTTNQGGNVDWASVINSTLSIVLTLINNNSGSGNSGGGF